MPLISVIVPVYNVEKYLNRCVDSILNQTFKDFELIMVDDGSTDGSSELCDILAEKDRRIKVFHQENQGQAAARNYALDICKGDYIAFVDSDDYIHPEMFEILINNIEKNKADVAVCNYNKGKLTAHTWEQSQTYINVYGGKEFVEKCLLQKTGKNWLLWDKVYKKSCFQNIRLPEGRIYEDNATVYKILYNADRVVDCDSVLYYYFTNDNSTVNQEFTLKNLDWLLVIEEMISFFEEKKETELLDWANKYYINQISYLYSKVRNCCSDKLVETQLKDKLLKQYKSEKKKYRINIKTYPNVIKILYPTYSKMYRLIYHICSEMYWLFKALKNKLYGK